MHDILRRGLRVLRPLLAAAALTTTALAGVRDDAIGDAHYLEYGQKFSGYTVFVASRQASGTGVLISPRWCLTAAHVAEAGADFKVGKLTVSRVVIHPQFDPNKIAFYDVALLHLDRDAGRPYYPPLSAGRDNEGAVVSIAGYGVTGVMSDGVNRVGDALLRAGTARVSRATPETLVCPIQRGGTALPFGIASGDSGGPMFLGGRLAGIASCTTCDGRDCIPCSRAGEEQVFVRVSAVRDWVMEVTKDE
jgi:hypothetical protein